MTALANLSFLNRSFITPFNQGKTPEQKTTIKDYLISQTAFSTAFGFLVCRLPFFQSAALGLATEGCRYVTDQVIAQLSTKFSFIENNRTAVKTALVAGSFFLAKAVINTILPGSSTFLKAGLLMSAAYLVMEPIATRVHEACTTNEKTVQQCFYNGKENLVGDLTKQYPTAMQKITDLWNHFFGLNGGSLK